MNRIKQKPAEPEGGSTPLSRKFKEEVAGEKKVQDGIGRKSGNSRGTSVERSEYNREGSSGKAKGVFTIDEINKRKADLEEQEQQARIDVANQISMMIKRNVTLHKEPITVIQMGPKMAAFASVLATGFLWLKNQDPCGYSDGQWYPPFEQYLDPNHASESILLNNPEAYKRMSDEIHYHIGRGMAQSIWYSWFDAVPYAMIAQLTFYVLQQTFVPHLAGHEFLFFVYCSCLTLFIGSATLYFSENNSQDKFMLVRMSNYFFLFLFVVVCGYVDLRPTSKKITTVTEDYMAKVHGDSSLSTYLPRDSEQYKSSERAVKQKLMRIFRTGLKKFCIMLLAFGAGQTAGYYCSMAFFPNLIQKIHADGYPKFICDYVIEGLFVIFFFNGVVLPMQKMIAFAVNGLLECNFEYHMLMGTVEEGRIQAEAIKYISNYCTDILRHVYGRRVYTYMTSKLLMALFAAKDFAYDVTVFGVQYSDFYLVHVFRSHYQSCRNEDYNENAMKMFEWRARWNDWKKRIRLNVLWTHWKTQIDFRDCMIDVQSTLDEEDFLNLNPESGDDYYPKSRGAMISGQAEMAIQMVPKNEKVGGNLQAKDGRTGAALKAAKEAAEQKAKDEMYRAQLGLSPDQSLAAARSNSITASGMIAGLAVASQTDIGALLKKDLTRDETGMKIRIAIGNHSATIYNAPVDYLRTLQAWREIRARQRVKYLEDYLKTGRKIGQNSSPYSAIGKQKGLKISNLQNLGGVGGIPGVSYMQLLNLYSAHSGGTMASYNAISAIKMGKGAATELGITIGNKMKNGITNIKNMTAAARDGHHGTRGREDSIINLDPVSLYPPISRSGSIQSGVGGRVRKSNSHWSTGKSGSFLKSGSGGGGGLIQPYTGGIESIMEYFTGLRMSEDEPILLSDSLSKIRTPVFLRYQARISAKFFCTFMMLFAPYCLKMFPSVGNAQFDHRPGAPDVTGLGKADADYLVKIVCLAILDIVEWKVILNFFQINFGEDLSIRLGLYKRVKDYCYTALLVISVFAGLFLYAVNAFEGQGAEMAFHLVRRDLPSIKAANYSSELRTAFANFEIWFGYDEAGFFGNSEGFVRILYRMQMLCLGVSPFDVADLRGSYYYSR